MSISERGWLLLLFLLAGCSSEAAPVHEDAEGFRFTPPPGWVERANDSLKVPARRSSLPLPRLGIPGAGEERLRVRHDRLTAGSLAWLQVTAADVPASMPFTKWLPAHSPGADWKRELELETLQIGGLPAARLAWVGRWHNQDYLCESVAVRHDQRVFIFTASLPRSDSQGREEVRQAIASVVWR